MRTKTDRNGINYVYKIHDSHQQYLYEKKPKDTMCLFLILSEVDFINLHLSKLQVNIEFRLIFLLDRFSNSFVSRPVCR